MRVRDLQTVAGKRPTCSQARAFEQLHFRVENLGHDSLFLLDYITLDRSLQLNSWIGTVYNGVWYRFATVYIMFMTLKSLRFWSSEVDFRLWQWAIWPKMPSDLTPWLHLLSSLGFRHIIFAWLPLRMSRWTFITSLDIVVSCKNSLDSGFWPQIRTKVWGNRKDESYLEAPSLKGTSQTFISGDFILRMHSFLISRICSLFGGVRLCERVNERK